MSMSFFSFVGQLKALSAIKRIAACETLTVIWECNKVFAYVKQHMYIASKKKKKKMKKVAHVHIMNVALQNTKRKHVSDWVSFKCL